MQSLCLARKEWLTDILEVELKISEIHHFPDMDPKECVPNFMYKKTGTDAEADSDDSGTDIAYSESDYEQRDSDLEFAAEYCVWRGITWVSAIHVYIRNNQLTW